MIKIFQIHSIVLSILLVPYIACAQAVITEIMYDPAGADSGHEWIEIYNTGTSTIPLSTWKLYEGGSNHKITTVSGGAMLAPNTYAIIASNATRFQTDYPSYAGVLFHSAFSLDNGGATLSLRDKSLTDIDTISYDSSWGGLGDGNSLQRAPGDGGQFIPRTPTPGAAISATTVAPKTTPIASPTKAPAKTTARSTKQAADPSEVKPRASITDVRASNDAGNVAVVTPQVAAVAAPDIDSYWFFALAAVLLLAIAAIAVSRHFKKSEWDIIEESSEDV